MTLDELFREYAQAAMLAEIFGERFWKWEQRRTRLLDQLENEFLVAPSQPTQLGKRRNNKKEINESI
jgi:hypothetical protein